MKLSLISSLYRTDVHIDAWKSKVLGVAGELASAGQDFELIAVANDPTPKEIEVIESMKNEPWFRSIVVPREKLYASWNRGVKAATGEVCSFWNVDDIRFAEAMIDGVRRIAGGAEVVYFPFIYKRYVRIFGIPVLAKVKTIVPPPFDKQEFQSAMHSGPFFMFSRNILDSVGYFDESFMIAGDFDWCARAAGTATFERSDIVAGIFKNDGTTLSGSKNSRQQDENARIYKMPKGDKLRA